MNIPDVNIPADIIPAEDTQTFEAQVSSVAHKIAAQSTPMGIPDSAEIKDLVPFVRMQLMARRNKSVFDRIAGAINGRVTAILGHKVAAEREVENLLALQNQHTGLIASHAMKVETLKRADATADDIRNLIADAKAEVVRSFTLDHGSYKGSGSPAENVLAIYRTVVAGERALAEFGEARAKIVDEVSKAEQSIAAFKAKHSDIFGG